MKRSDDVHKLAHDFNNLLTAIIGATDAILQRSEIDPETCADIAHIREGARRGSTLVQRLRGSTQDAGDPPSIISVNETIRATWRLLDHGLGENIDLLLDLAEPGAQVAIDPSQLDRVLLNLIANARHAMPNGGPVPWALHAAPSLSRKRGCRTRSSRRLRGDRGRRWRDRYSP